jgi:hypothetical protein
VAHTNGEPGIILNLGTMKPLGHMDFYPNGGGEQPGCILDPFVKENGEELLVGECGEGCRITTDLLS